MDSYLTEFRNYINKNPFEFILNNIEKQSFTF